MKTSLAILLIAVFLSGCATTGNNNTKPAVDNSKLNCPAKAEDLNQYKTEDQVIGCLGKPHHVSSKPDGQHTGLYNLQGGFTIVFLYDGKGAVIRPNIYKHQ